RALIALSLASSPEVVFMDEPTTAVDVVMQRQILSQILQLQAALGFAIVFVTHDLEEAIALADRVVIMSAGPAARIIGDWRVPLARPRDILEIRLEPAFHDLHREIWHVL
ncbi:UNVERIFIED_CONTAM: ABC transporter ATP-binding protein, partial [Bacteroidetes bacterium 56_B9]